MIDSYSQDSLQFPPIINCTIHNDETEVQSFGRMMTQNGPNGLSFTMKGDMNLSNIEIELSDMIGKTTSIKLTTNEQGELDISKLQSGVYIVVVNSKELYSIGKLIVQP